MIDAKRIGYLTFLALLIGLAVVHLRTGHTQAVHRAVQLSEQKQQVAHDVWEQHVLLSQQMESPVRLKERIALAQVPVEPPGRERQGAVLLAGGQGDQ